MNFQRRVGKLFSAWQILRGEIYPSGSQAGEDQLVRYILYNCLNIATPTYLDIGANHPFKCNNTFFFYSRGSTGVCVEPDPGFYKLLKRYRSRDIILQLGVGIKNMAEADLYVFPSKVSGWNTFSKEEAEFRMKESGVLIEKVIKVPLKSVNEIIDEYFTHCPNFISIDIEGLDLAILKSIDFSKYQPQVICVETITFSSQNQGKKLKEIPEFMNSVGYFSYGDTYINTIFCRKDIF